MKTDISRRRFVRVAAGAAIGGALTGASSGMWAQGRKLPRGIQLYTVRDLLAKDFYGTLRQVALAGFQEVEAAGYYGRTAAQFRNAVELEGMKCVSAHHSLADLVAKRDELRQFGHELGLKYLVCSAPRGRNAATKDKDLTLDDWKWNFEQFNILGEKVKAGGMQFGYHNHVNEFKRLDGKLVYDELLKQTDPKLVTMEMDCGWVVAAGYKPTDYLNRYPARYTLLHVKDMVMKAGTEPHSTELGRGNIDYAPIFAAAKHVQHYFYEQEEFEGAPMDALKESSEYLKKSSF